MLETTTAPLIYNSSNVVQVIIFQKFHGLILIHISVSRQAMANSILPLPQFVRGEQKRQTCLRPIDTLICSSKVIEKKVNLQMIKVLIKNTSCAKHSDHP